MRKKILGKNYWHECKRQKFIQRRYEENAEEEKVVENEKEESAEEANLRSDCFPKENALEKTFEKSRKILQRKEMPQKNMLRKNSWN